MAGGVDRLAHRGDVAGDAGRGFIVRRGHGLDRVRLVGAQDLFDLLRLDARAPFLFEDLHVIAHALRHIDPEMAELAEARHQNLVAGRQCVGEGGFPGASAGGREKKDLTVFGLVDLLQILEQRQRQFGEFRRPMVFHWHDHRTQNPIGNIGRPRNEKKVATRHHAPP